MTWRARRGGVSRWVKQRIVRSPAEPAFRRLQLALEWVKGRRDPAFAKLHREKSAIRAALALMVDRDSVCLDAGGHIGSVLSDLCRLAPDATHTAIEADPDKAAWLARRFPEVDVIAAAVMDEAGTVRFGIDLDRDGYSHVVADDSAPSSASVRVIEVPAVTLDTLVGTRRVDVIKLDVEGAELAALRGASTLLAVQRPRILFEAGLMPGDPWESDLPDLFALLEGAGYRIWLVTDFVDGLEPLDLDAFVRAHQLPYQGWNYVALPKEDALAQRDALSAGSRAASAA